MKRGIPALVLRLAGLLAAGCVARRAIVGRDIERDRVKAIRPRVTTTSDIIEWFGTPDSVLHYPDGSRQFRYSYTGWRDRTVHLVLYTRSRTEKEFKNLLIRTQDGVVTQFTYSDSNRPRDNIAR